MAPVSSKETTASLTNESFDFTRHVKLVPPFQEHEVDDFFLHFEQVATNLHWPSEVGISHVAAKRVNWEGS